LQIDPKHTKAWRWRGFALRSLEKFDDAAKCFDKEIELNPTGAYSWFIWYNRGLMVHIQDRFDEAIKCYETSINLYPEHADAWYCKGLLLIIWKNMTKR